MNTSPTVPLVRHPQPRLAKRQSLPLSVLAATLVWVAGASAQISTFDGGNDAGWLRSTTPEATFSFPPDATGGHAYRLQGDPARSGAETNARAFSYLTNRIYTNFFAAVDVVAWNTNQDCNLVLGLIARASSNEILYGGVPFDPNRPTGLTLNVRLHNWRAYVGPGNTGPLGSRDQMSIWGIVNAAGTLMLGNPAAVTQVGFRWVPGRAYRLVLSNTNNLGDWPQYYTGAIYDVNDLTRPLLTMTGDDSYFGNSMYIPPYGYAGVFGYHLSDGDPDPTMDVTFDNFYVGETPPPGVAAPGIPHGLPGAPQVVNRSPASFQNFHPAASGITFQATTLTTTNGVKADAIKLYLNCVNVSADLAISGEATNLSVAYAGLAANTVYQARIELEDTLGRCATNEFTFDTFSDAYLASGDVKIIECEDYDYAGGQFLNNPLASGYLTNGTGPINAGSGYVELSGTAGLDFFDHNSGPNLEANAFRSGDPVGTQQGNYGAFYYADVNEMSGFGYSQYYDTQRSKYANVNPALHEYIVTRLEGSEWLNYTRVFEGTRHYNAYLRTACGLAQPVAFQHIAAGPATNTLGRFEVPSTFYHHNYQYVPLRAADGTLSVVNLSGTATVRLLLDSLRNDATKYGLAMNYVALVPAAPQLLSAAAVNDVFTLETCVLVDAEAKKITVPQRDSTRFYRILWTQPVRITGIAFAGENVILNYQ